MRHVAAMLACPHAWGEERAVTLSDKGKLRDGKLSTCARCGTHRIKWPDGMATMCSPDAISTKASEAAR